MAVFFSDGRASASRESTACTRARRRCNTELARKVVLHGQPSGLSRCFKLVLGGQPSPNQFKAKTHEPVVIQAPTA